MSRKTRTRSASMATLAAAALALALLTAPGSLAKGTPKPPKTKLSTGSATHLRGSAALLTGTVYPNGAETSYYFQYGLTNAYGAQTPTASAGNASAKVPVGQPISGLVPGDTYHFRIVGLVAGNPTPLLGRDKTFIAGGPTSTRQALKVAKPTAAVVYGKSFLISGTLTGLGNANAPVVLQASPYPYLEPFVNIGSTGYTNAAGAFSFRVSNLSSNTQFRVSTLGRLPVYSPIVTEDVALAITLRAQPTKRPGFVRLYGTVQPAAPGKSIVFQLEKAVRPSGRSEATSRFVTEFLTRVARGGHSFSRFSQIVEVRHAGVYRAEIKLPKGPIATGTSNTVTLRTVARKR